MPPKQKFRPLRKPIRRPKGGGKAKLGKKYTFYSNYSPKANLFSERIRIILFTCNGGSKSSVSLLMSTAVEAVVATGDEGEEESTLRLELTTESCRTWKKKASLVMRWGCQLACPTFKCQLVQKMGEWKWWLLSTRSSTEINILSSTYMIGTGCANKFEIELKLYLKLNWIFQSSKKCWSRPRMASRLLRSTSLSYSLPARTCWVTQYAVLAVNVDDRKCQRFLEERPLVRYFSLRTHPEKTKNNWPLSTIDIEREKICQWSFFSSFF